MRCMQEEDVEVTFYVDEVLPKEFVSSIMNDLKCMSKNVLTTISKVSSSFQFIHSNNSTSSD